MMHPSPFGHYSCHRRSEKGLEVSLLAWLGITRHLRLWPHCRADTLQATRPLSRQGTRIDASLEQCATLASVTTTSSIYAM